MKEPPNEKTGPFQNWESQVSAAVAELESAANFLRSPYFMAKFGQELRRAAVESVSPWLDRESAAAYAHCSVSEIDRAVTAGVLKRYKRNETPLLLKSEIDEAIKSGNWRRKS